MSDKFGVQHG